jgi:hypothetical protein
MKVKVLEIRDKATFIPVMGINIRPENEDQKYLLGRAGYGVTADAQGGYIILVKMTGDIVTANHDPFSWGSPTIRTMQIAHKHIIDNWDSLSDGDVIDVEYILYETKECKVSERYG